MTSNISAVARKSWNILVFAFFFPSQLYWFELKYTRSFRNGNLKGPSRQERLLDAVIKYEDPFLKIRLKYRRFSSDSSIV